MPAKTTGHPAMQTQSVCVDVGRLSAESTLPGHFNTVGVQRALFQDLSSEHMLRKRMPGA